MQIVGIVIAVLVILAIAAGFIIAGFALAIKPCTPEESRAWQEEHYDLSWYDPLEKTDYTVTSYDGYVLHAQFLRNPGDTNRCVLLSHANTGNRFGVMKYAVMYLEQGFHVIVYDLRGHGLNEPTFCTFTVRERKDLQAMILDSRKRYLNASLFGIHGESLGAATSIAVLEEKPPVDFVVADCGFSDIVPVSARRNKGIDELVKCIVHYLPEGPKYFPEDMMTDQPERVICAEIIREKALRHLRDEVPHGIGVEIMGIEKISDNLTEINATIYCERDAHKGIIIGHHGSMLQTIGTEARTDVERLLDTHVNLKLWVKIRPDWRNNPSDLKNLGYEK